LQEYHRAGVKRPESSIAAAAVYHISGAANRPVSSNVFRTAAEKSIEHEGLDVRTYLLMNRMKKGTRLLTFGRRFRRGQ
jgi:hypothetical protein